MENSIVGMLVGGIAAGIDSESLRYSFVQNVYSMASIAVIFYNDYASALHELNTNIQEPDLSVYKLFMTILHGILHGLRRKELKNLSCYDNLQLRNSIRNLLNTNEEISKGACDEEGKEGKEDVDKREKSEANQSALDHAFAKAWHVFMKSVSFTKGLNSLDDPISKGLYGLMTGAYYGFDHFDDDIISSVASDELDVLIKDYIRGLDAGTPESV